jgi:hypothetical protein
MECSYCKHKLSNNSALKFHQKSAKYCLKLQGRNSTLFKCKFCDKQLSTNQHLLGHLGICDVKIKIDYDSKYKHIIEELKSQLLDQKEQYEEHIAKKDKHIRELEDKLENIAIKAVQRPTTRNTQINNYIQQLKHVTEEHLIESVPNLTIDHIIKGPEGYAEYALNYPLKDRLLCSDYSRRKVKFKDKDGKVITDPEMTTLALKFFGSIKDKNKELIRKYANEAKEKLGDDNVMDTVVKLFDYKAAVENGSDGVDKTEFHHDFVRQMCSQTLKE